MGTPALGADPDCACIDVVGEIIPKTGFDANNGKCKNGKPSFITGYVQMQGTLGATGAPLAPSGLDMEDARAGTLYDSYAGLRATLKNTDPYKKDGPHAAFKGSPKEVADRLNQYLAGKGKLDERSAAVMQAFHQGMYLTGAEFKAYAGALKSKGMSTDEILLVGQLLFGSRGYANYDEKRAAAGMGAKGVVSRDEILIAARHNSDKGYFSAKVVDAQADALEAGMCGDIASAQAEFYRDAGLKAWVVSYGFSGSDDHAAVVVQDPDKKGRLHSVNGSSRLTVDNREGGEALYLGSSDASVKYDLSDPAGGTKIVVESTLASDMRKLAGFHMDKYDPLAPNNSQIVRGGVSVGSSANTSMGLGMSHNVNGQSVYGGTFSTKIPEGKYFQTNIGLVAGVMVAQTTAAAKGLPGADTLGVGYVRVEQDGKTPCLHLGSEKFCGRFEGNIMTAHLYRYSFSAPDKKYEGNFSIGQVDVRARGGLVFEYVDAKAAHRTWLGCEATYGYADVRAPHPLLSPAIVLNKCAVMNETGIKVKDTQILIGSSVLHYPGVGATVGQAKAGVAAGGFRGIAGVQGPLTKDTPAFVAGSIPTVFAEGSYTFATHPTTLFLRVSQALQTSSDVAPPPTTATGGLNANF